MQDNHYYILKPAVGTEETGMAFPAVESYDDYDFDGPSSVHTLKTHTPIINDIDIKFKLAKKANFTDLLSQATINSTGFLISEKFLSIIETYNVIPFAIYPTEIVSKQSTKTYYWIHFVWQEWHEYVNWQLSTFRLFENGGFTPIEINSYSQYIKEVNKSQYFRIAPDKPILFQIDYDLYNHPFQGETFISKEFAIAISSNNLTGIDISENLNLTT